MQDLTPAGLTEDGTCLLLVTARGERFLLPVDDQLQRLVGTARRATSAPEPPTEVPVAAAPAPVSADLPARRPHQQEQTMESALRPRDIQARIRGGESAETVAAAAGTSVEAIMPFAGPVLAERAHQAQTALRASVRRGAGPSGGARTLGDAVSQFLATHHLQDDDVTWDSWRRPDGRWALTAQVEAGGRAHAAEFVHDVAGRYVVSENDAAKLLTGEAAPSGPAGASGDAPGDPAPRRLSAVGDPDRYPGAGGAQGDTLRDTLGEDAIALVRERRDEPTVLGAPASAAPAPVSTPTAVPAAEVDEVPEVAGVDEVPELDEETVEVRPEDDEPADGPDGEQAAEVDDDQPALDLGVPEPSEQPDQPKRSGRRGRSSVPSWDEIMFGGGPSKD